MPHKSSFRFPAGPVCIALGILLILLAFAGCSDGAKPTETVPGAQTSAETLPETEPLPEGLVLDESFLILCATGQAAADAAETIRAAVADLYGFSLTVQTEKAYGAKDPVLEGKAILIGATSKDLSTRAMEDLREKDSLYYVPDENAVVIGGWNAESLQKAAQAFLEEQYGYTGPGTGRKTGIAPGTKQVFRDGTYPFSSLTCNGIDARHLTIYYSGSEGKTAGSLIVERVTNLTGYIPKLVAVSGGSTGEPGIYLYAGVGKLDYSIAREGDSVVIQAPANQLKTAVNEFLSEYFVFQDTDTEELQIETSPLTRLAYVSGVKYDNGVRLTGREDTEIKEGITYVELTYVRKDGRPVVVKAVIAKKDAADVMIGSPKAQTAIDTVQTPLGQARAAEEKWDVNVIAAANGDLFGYCYPLGPMYQNGVLIAEKYVDGNGNPAWTKHCFGVRTDGSFYIGTQVKSSLWYQLVGGEGIILRSGEIVECINDQFFTENHPRTAIGYDKGGTLYLVEIDGRQSELSNGASFMDMALIFKYLGATDALNLDGGGSSVLYVENPETGELEIKTSPSDEGHEVRACANSILLIDKKNG